MSQAIAFKNSPGVELSVHPFLKELVHQIRAQDTTDRFRLWSDESLLEALVIPSKKACRAAKPDPEIDTLVCLQVSAFYRAIAEFIRLETNQLVETFVNVNRRGVSSVVVFCGHLLVVFELLREVQCFGFESLEKIVEAGERGIGSAIAKAKQFFDLPSFDSAY